MPFQLMNSSQRDPRWKDIKLGFSSDSTIGAHGCAITCLSMWLSGFGYLETPDTLNAGLKKHGGFTQDEIQWASVSSIYPMVKYKSIYVCRDSDAPIDMIRASIAVGQPVILQVDSSPSTGLQTHWVLAYATQKTGDSEDDVDFLILDPWPYPSEQGKEISLLTRYGQGQARAICQANRTGAYPKLMRAISAAIFFECQIAADGSVTILEPPALHEAGSLYVRVRSQVFAGLRIRSIPNTASETLSFEYPGSYLKVIESEASANPKIGVYDQWLRVRNSIGVEGYVAAWYVDGIRPISAPGNVVASSTAKQFPLCDDSVICFPRDLPNPALRVRPSVGDGLENVLTPAPIEQQLTITSDQSGSYRVVADIWNHYGGILSALSSKLGIEPGIAVATLGVESGGLAFGPDGRLLIRFENHLFYHYWGQNNLEKYNKFFTFNLNQRWTGHKWRSDPKSAWNDLHTNQAREWDVFNFACALDESAAMYSISMGAPQIMGFNYAVIGYASVRDMFAVFARSGSERDQVISFFDFVQGVLPFEAALKTLRSKNFLQFATIYNGIGQAPTYAGLIKSAYKAFSTMIAVSQVVKP